VRWIPSAYTAQGSETWHQRLLRYVFRRGERLVGPEARRRRRAGQMGDRQVRGQPPIQPDARVGAALGRRHHPAPDAVEHPGGRSGTLYIENLTLHPTGKLVPPWWLNAGVGQNLLQAIDVTHVNLCTFWPRTSWSNASATQDCSITSPSTRSWSRAGPHVPQAHRRHPRPQQTGGADGLAAGLIGKRPSLAPGLGWVRRR
jgi:hypothetical protein